MIALISPPDYSGFVRSIPELCCLGLCYSPAICPGGDPTYIDALYSNGCRKVYGVVNGPVPVNIAAHKFSSLHAVQRENGIVSVGERRHKR
jgi:hypothetical protein